MENVLSSTQVLMGGNKTTHRQMAIDLVDTLHAIVTLEYHNKNFLAYDNCRRNEVKRELLSELKSKLLEMGE